MSRTALFIVAIALSNLARAQDSAPTSAPQQRERLAVMPLTGANVDEDLPAILDDFVTVEIAKSGAYDVVSAEEIRSVLGLEQMKQVLGCDEISCLVEISGALDVRYLVWGKVSRLGDKLNISLSLTDVREMRTVHRHIETVDYDENLFPAAAQRAAVALLPQSSTHASAAAPATHHTAEAQPEPPALAKKHTFAVGVGLLMPPTMLTTGLVFESWSTVLPLEFYLRMDDRLAFSSSLLLSGVNYFDDSLAFFDMTATLGLRWSPQGTGLAGLYLAARPGVALGGRIYNGSDPSPTLKLSVFPEVGYTYLWRDPDFYLTVGLGLLASVAIVANGDIGLFVPFADTDDAMDNLHLLMPMLTLNVGYAF